MSGHRPLVAGAVLTATGLAGLLCSCSQSAPASSTIQLGRTPTATMQTTTGSTADRSSCSRSAIKVSVRLRGGAASQTRTVIVLINRGRSACVIEGYPRIAAVGQEARGPVHALPTHVADGGTYFAADPGPHPVTLAPGAAASSTMETFLAYVGATARTTALTVTPPGPAAARVTVPYRIAMSRPAGQAYPVVVTALVAGSNGPPA